MRTVYVDLSSDICIKPIFAGYEGEHNATQLTVKIPNRMIINNVDYYTFCFELPTGECIESDGYAFQYLNNGELSLYLPKQIMVRGDIIVAINAYCVTTDESTSETTVNLLEKTSEIRLFIENSPNGRYTKYDDRELSNIVWKFDGKDGKDGADGYTPVRGKDYWTADDIAEIKAYVDAAILGGVW